MDAFLAFLDHIHSLLTSTNHNTPIILMASPQWTRPDCEIIARYIFEKTKTPALCLIHSGVATQYGLKWPNMTVVDIGYQKVDVTGTQARGRDSRPRGGAVLRGRQREEEGEADKRARFVNGSKRGKETGRRGPMNTL